jgi:hypothetical protein
MAIMIAKTRRSVGLALVLAASLLFSSAAAQATARASSAATVTVVATGLNNPRGLHFGPDGQLYVAEGGLGGTSMNTVGLCQQVPPPVGPYTSDGNSASIARINPETGAVTRVATHLPSSQTSLALGGLVSGVADIAFIKGTLYAMISGAGCSHALAGTHNAIVRVNPDGSTTQVANLSRFLMTHPVANPEPSVPPGDFEPDGTWYGMAPKGDALYALEPNHQEMDRINTANGHISRVVDFSKTFVAPEDWRGPTAITRGGGSFYVGTLTPFPVVPGAAQVFKVNPGGHFRLFAGGLTTVLGLAVDASGRLYVLEMSDAPGFPAPGAGDIVRINRDGTRQTIATGLNLPTAMTMGPDGNLYVSNQGFGFPPGAGEIVKVTVPN